MRCKLIKRQEVSLRPKLGTGIRKKMFLGLCRTCNTLIVFRQSPNQIYILWYCLYCCHCQCESSFKLRKLARLSFVRLAFLFTYLYPLMSRNARQDEVGKIVKIANKAFHCLAGDFDNFANFASNQ